MIGSVFSWGLHVVPMSVCVLFSFMYELSRCLCACQIHMFSVSLALRIQLNLLHVWVSFEAQSVFHWIWADLIRKQSIIGGIDQ